MHALLKNMSFCCDFEGCDYIAQSNYALKEHKRIHSDDRPFKCDIDGCGFSCKRANQFVVHQRIHNGMKPFRCDECGSFFKSSGELSEHKRYHNNQDKHFKCDFENCNYTTNSSSYFAIHKRTHTGEKPFICDFEGCNYACSSNSCLTKHKRIHTGERPFKCSFPDCRESFKQASTLKRHEATHVGDKCFVCNEMDFITLEKCNASFLRLDTLKKHIKCMHTESGRKRTKKHEERIEKVLKQNGFDFIREQTIDFTCVDTIDRESGDGRKRARIDFVIQTKDLLIFLEVDEDQHMYSDYSTCDGSRMTRIHESLALGGNAMDIVFVRYCPNGTWIDANNHKVKLTREDRESKLVEVLKRISDKKNIQKDSSKLHIIYICYNFDCETKMPIPVTRMPDYLKACVSW